MATLSLMTNPSTVLVTGGSGFLASHTIVQLLAAGHRVRATVRRPGREHDVRALLRAGGAPLDAPVSFAVADLTSDAGWAEATAGCEHVLHVASPFPPSAPAHEDDLIVPAREGTLRVLRAAREAGVRRVVMTSSFGAIGYGHEPLARPFDERDWTDPSRPEVSAYVKSKTLAERAAWAFVEREGGSLELTVINPTGIFGPVLGPDGASSTRIIERMLAGKMPFCPRLFFGVVDVRDVADLHLRAMTSPAAKGERFLATAGDFLSMLDVARVLRARLGEAAGKVPTRELPGWLVRLLAVAVPALRGTLPELGKEKNGSSDKARQRLGWSPRPADEAIVATAESLRRLGLVTTG